MGQKVSPISFRLGGLRTWSSKWFSDGRKYREYLIEDIKLRKLIANKLKNAALSKIEIERSPQSVSFNLYSSRPGIIIGRGGVEVEELKKEIAKHVKQGVKVDVNIKEIRDSESDAATVAFLIAEQIEKRISFRRVLKRTLERSMQSSKVKGMKIMVAGRLDGADMSRTEWVGNGKLPLHTIRADIDYAKKNAYTTYGVIGIKVWIYKGEVFKDS